MELLTYEEFKEYTGTDINEKRYKLLLTEVLAEINILSNINILNIDNVGETTKLLLSKVLLDTIEYEEKKGINSESVGRWSISYNTDASIFKNNRLNKLRDIIAYIKQEKGLETGNSLFVKG